MILWFAGVSFVFVWWVFKSPALDYRLVMLGSVLPLGEVVFGGPRVLHTLVGPVALLAVVMLATQKRRLVRRRWIGLPIGLLMHLALDGVWTRADVFWWPFLGWSFGTAGLPELDRPVGVVVLLELAGVIGLAWAYRSFGLDRPGPRDRFLRTGQLDRSVEQPPTC
jgi:hypothetical protein